MKLAADTSALLSLACSKHLHVILQQHELIITLSVQEELQQFARYDDLLGRKAKDLLKRNLPIHNPKNALELGLEQAESDVFSVAHEKHMLALTDDIHAARRAAEKLGLQTCPSFYLLLLIYKENKIKRDELIADIKTILEQRNWLEGALLEYALQLIKELK